MNNQTPATKPDMLFEALGKLVCTLGSKTRLKILYLLSQAPRSVESLASLTGETVANTSQHLRRLLSEGLVVLKKEKLSHIYNISSADTALLIETLFDLAENISPAVIFSQSAQSVAGEQPLMVPFSAIESTPSNSHKTVIIDVRDNYEANCTPVAGAVSVPLVDLIKRAKSFSKNKTYYLFCRGRACTQASEGVTILRAMGFTAYRLKESPVTLQKIKTLNNKPSQKPKGEQV